MKKSLILVFSAILLLSSFEVILCSDMNYIQNKGQWDSEILFTAQRDGLITSVTNSGIYFDFFEKSNYRVLGNVIKFNLINANKLNFKADKKSSSKFNYFIGNDKNKWITNVHSFESLVAKEVYEGIDLKYYVENNNPRYDFVIEPYADLAQINIEFEGVNEISINNGDIVLLTESVTIKNTNLFAYQFIDNKKQQVECSFVLNGNNLSFKVGDYDNSKQLIIDPIIYTSYYGSAGDDLPSKIKFIDDTSFLIVGNTNSIDFKTTTGAYDEEYAERTDAFVTKFNIVNAEYIPEFTTYIGSLEYDNAIDFIIEKDFILVTGETESPDFPTLKPIKSVHGGGKDIFISSLSIDGSELLQSTFYGGNDDDVVVEVNRIRNGVFLFAAYTNSNNIPTVSGPTNSNYKNSTDILLFSIVQNRESVNMSAYIGGQLEDVPTDMFVDPGSDKIFLTGYTTSSKGSTVDFPVMPPRRFGRGGAYDETSNGRKDAFAMMFTPNAQSLEISTFLGGDGDDIGRGIWSDANENIFVMGETYNNNSTGVPFPVTSGDEKVLGGSDIFLTMFNDLEEVFGIKTQTLNYSKLIRTQGNEILRDFKKFPDDSKFSFILSSDGKFPEVDPNDVKSKLDMVYSEVEPLSGEIISSKNFGGREDDIPVSFDFDSYRNYIIAGYTNSNDFNITENANQPELSELKDVVIVRNAIGNMTLLNPPTNQTLCVGNEVNISWTGENIPLENGFSVAYSSDENNDIFITIDSIVTNNSLLWTVPNELSGKDNVIIRVTHNSGIFSQNIEFYEVNERASLNSFELLSADTVCIGESISLKANTTGVDINYTWYKDNQEIAKTDTNLLVIDNVDMSNSGTYKVSIKNICPPAAESENSIVVYVSPYTDALDLEDSFSKKKGETFELEVSSVGSNLSYKWQKNGSTLSSQNTKTLMLSNLSTTDSGEYRCIVTGLCGIDTTNTTSLTVEDVIGSVSDFYDLEDIANISEINPNIYSISSKNSKDNDITLYDNIGNKLFDNNFNSTFEINLNNYINGVYWIVISQNNKIYKSKLLKLN